LTDQQRVGAADRRQVEQHAEVAGDAEAPRVQLPVPVDEEQVRSGLKLAEHIQCDRCGPERSRPATDWIAPISSLRET
jgi:hypothetical protein